MQISSVMEISILLLSTIACLNFGFSTEDIIKKTSCNQEDKNLSWKNVAKFYTNRKVEMQLLIIHYWV